MSTRTIGFPSDPADGEVFEGWKWDGSKWEWVKSGGSGGGLWEADGDDIYYDKGNVGIGTASSGSTMLAITQNSASQRAKVSTTDDSGRTLELGSWGSSTRLKSTTRLDVGSGASEPVVISTDGSERMTIDADGYTNITVPFTSSMRVMRQGATGDVQTSGIVFGNDFSTNGMGISASAETGFRFKSTTDTSSTGPLGNSVSTDLMRINADGNVGIGASEPMRLSGGKYLIIDHNNETGIELGINGVPHGELFASGNDVYLANRSANSIIFRTNGSNERMRIDANGSVHIGRPVNDSQGYTIDLSPDIQQTAGIDVNKTSPNVNLDLYAGGSPTNSGGWSGQIRFFTGGSNQLGTERMRIGANGRVDITGSLYVNGTPKIGYSELITTLVTLRNATQDETTLEGLRDSIGNAIGGLIEKFEQEIATMPAEDSE